MQSLTHTKNPVVLHNNKQKRPPTRIVYDGPIHSLESKIISICCPIVLSIFTRNKGKTKNTCESTNRVSASLSFSFFVGSASVATKQRGSVHPPEAWQTTPSYPQSCWQPQQRQPPSRRSPPSVRSSLVILRLLQPQRRSSSSSVPQTRRRPRVQQHQKQHKQQQCSHKNSRHQRAHLPPRSGSKQMLEARSRRVARGPRAHRGLPQSKTHQGVHRSLRQGPKRRAPSRALSRSLQRHSRSQKHPQRRSQRAKAARWPSTASTR